MTAKTIYHNHFIADDLVHITWYTLARPDNYSRERTVHFSDKIGGEVYLQITPAIRKRWKYDSTSFMPSVEENLVHRIQPC